MAASPTRRGAPRKRRARGSISAAEILRGAYELATEESLDALSMPRLAQRLDVGVTSIYWYFRSKEELLDTLADRAAAEFVRGFTVPDDLPWDEHLRAYFRNFRRLFVQDPLLCDLIIMRGPRQTPGRTRMAAERIDLVLRKLVTAGFPPETAMDTYGSLRVFTEGAIMMERLVLESEDPPLTAGPAADEVAGLEVLPRLAPTRRLTSSAEQDFEFGLENALRGLRVLLEDLLAEEPCVQQARAARAPDTPAGATSGTW